MTPKERPRHPNSGEIDIDRPGVTWKACLLALKSFGDPRKRLKTQSPEEEYVVMSSPVVLVGGLMVHVQLQTEV